MGELFHRSDTEGAGGDVGSNGGVAASGADPADVPSSIRRPKLLDLFCGAGGCTKGFQRAGFYVVGVDIEPQPNYCGDAFYQCDAINLLSRLVHGHGFLASDGGVYRLAGFAAVHASPPCQAYSNLADRSRHPALVDDVRDLLQATGLPYVIENVVGAPLRNPVMLCGSSFALGVERHRLFETNFPLMAPPCAHGQQEPKYRVYQRGRWYLSPVAHVWGSGGGKAREHWPEAMGIDWMDTHGLAEAIPPAYTEHIGIYLRQAIEYQAADTLQGSGL